MLSSCDPLLSENNYTTMASIYRDTLHFKCKDLPQSRLGFPAIHLTKTEHHQYDSPF